MEKEPAPWRGRWRVRLGVAAEAPLVVEVGCGSGEWLVRWAEQQRGWGFVGVEGRGDRLWFGAHKAKQNNVKNVTLVWGRAEQLGEWFAPGEVDQVWVQFPEPHSAPGKQKRRLTSPRHMEIYRKILREGGTLHFKTDVPELLDYTLSTGRQMGFEVVEVNREYFRKRPDHLPHNLLTFYEERHLEHGKEIYYAQFTLQKK